jgi:hypothetical protein
MSSCGSVVPWQFEHIISVETGATTVRLASTFPDIASFAVRVASW